jgi:hypothetical protein
MDGLAGLEADAHPGGAGQLPGGEVDGELTLEEPAGGVAHPPGLAEDRQVRLAVADERKRQVGPVDVQLGQAQPGGVQVGGDATDDPAPASCPASESIPAGRASSMQVPGGPGGFFCRGGRERRDDPLQQRQEVGGAAAAQLVHPGAGGDLQRSQHRDPPVLAGRGNLGAVSAQCPAGAQVRQQLQVGLIGGPDHRPGRQVPQPGGDRGQHGGPRSQLGRALRGPAESSRSACRQGRRYRNRTRRSDRARRIARRPGRTPHARFPAGRRRHRRYPLRAVQACVLIHCHMGI